MATRLTAADADDVYELPPVESVDAIPDAWQNPECDAILPVELSGLP